MNRIIARRDDGVEVDVTDDVRATYDVAVGSMDFGSGFLDAAGLVVAGVDAAIDAEPLEYQDDPCDNCAHERNYHHNGVCHRRTDGVIGWILAPDPLQCDCPGFVFDGAAAGSEVWQP